MFGEMIHAYSSIAFKESSDREIMWPSKAFTIFLVLALVGRIGTMRLLEKNQ